MEICILIGKNCGERVCQFWDLSHIYLFFDKNQVTKQLNNL